MYYSNATLNCEQPADTFVGKTGIARDYCGSPPRQLLGEIRSHCFRYCTKGYVDKLFIKEPESRFERSGNPLLLLVHYTKRLAQHVR